MTEQQLFDRMTTLFRRVGQPADASSEKDNAVRLDTLGHKWMVVQAVGDNGMTKVYYYLFPSDDSVVIHEDSVRKFPSLVA